MSSSSEETPSSQQEKLPSDGLPHVARPALATGSSQPDTDKTPSAAVNAEHLVSRTSRIRPMNNILEATFCGKHGSPDPGATEAVGVPGSPDGRGAVDGVKFLIFPHPNPSNDENRSPETSTDPSAPDRGDDDTIHTLVTSSCTRTAPGEAKKKKKEKRKKKESSFDLTRVADEIPKAGAQLPGTAAIRHRCTRNSHASAHVHH